MEIKRIATDFSVCKVTDYTGVDLTDDFCFIGKTDEENSLVCPTRAVPPNATARDDGWRAFRICGMLDLSLIGVLSEISGILAAEKIGIFAVSTYDTDYVLVKRGQYAQALCALSLAGYRIV